MPWITRGLRDGIVTTRYPRRADGYGDGFRAAITVLPASTGATRSTPVSFPAPLLVPTTRDRHGDANPVVPGDGPGEHAGVASGERTGTIPSGRTGDGPGKRTGHGPDGRTGTVPDDTIGATSGTSGELARLCPTGAIVEDSSGVHVDRGRCILCGACVAARPDRFAFDPYVETATASRPMLVVPERADDDDAALDRLRSDLARRTRALRRSIHLRHVDAGSDGAEEWEIAALTNPIYDVGRLGIFFTASPRHADLLLVTGVATAGMAEPLRRTYQAMPDPKIVLAAGTDAVSGGLVHPTYATRGSVASVLPVDIWVPGSPPSPFSLLHGILLAMGLMRRAPRRPALEAEQGDASADARRWGLDRPRSRGGERQPARSRRLDEEERQ